MATTSTTATIGWSTNEAATGDVAYGTTTSYGSSSTLEVTASTTHSATLTGLSPSTTYHYQITATDVAGNTATTSDATFTTAASPAAPTISNIAVSGVGTSTATVTWNTNLPSSSQVEYGTTTSYGSMSALNSAATTSHSVSLMSLSEGTLYHFAVMSGTGLATTTSADNEFVTQSTASSTPLAINGTTAVSTTGVADNLFSDGWQWVIHFTVPDNENAMRIRFSDWGNASSSFPAANDIQVFSPQSSNASTSASAILETGNGYGGWLYLTGDTAPLTPGRQIDLTVQVKIPFGTPNGSYSSNFTAQTYPASATSTAI